MPAKDHVSLTREQIKEIKVLASMLEETAKKLDNLTVRHHPDLVDADWLVRKAQRRIDYVLIKLT